MRGGTNGTWGSDMCIIGCEPKRAGHWCLVESALGSLDPKTELAMLAEHRIFLKKIPVKLRHIIPQEKKACKKPLLTPPQKMGLAKEAERIRRVILKIPEGMVLQGALVYAKEGDKYMELMNQITSLLAKELQYPNQESRRGIRTLWRHSTRCVTITDSGTYAISEWLFPRAKVYAVYSRRDDIQSYLYGDEKFTMTHWFVGNNPISYDELDKKRIPASVEIIQVKDRKQAKKLCRQLLKEIDKNPPITRCVFCSESDFEEFKVLKKKFPEVFWTRASVDN